MPASLTFDGDASRSASACPCTSPSSTPTRTPGSSATVRSRIDVLPAPGALIRLTANTPARSRSARLTAAIVSLASRTPSTTVTFVLCIRLHRLHLQVALDLGELQRDQGGHRQGERGQDVDQVDPHPDPHGVASS